MISAILIYTGKLARLNESLFGWQNQTFTGERELVIFNCSPRQRLKTDIEGIRIVNASRPMMPPQARNAAIEQTRGDIIVNWPEDDFCLPHHLQNIANGIDGRDWCWLDTELLMEYDKITRVQQSGAASFAFTKKAWEAAGRYSFGVNGASDRNFIGKITSKSKGEKITLNPLFVSYIQCGTEQEKKVMARMAFPGEMILKPEAAHDYERIAAEYFGQKSQKKIAVVILGRNGDIINTLPFLKAINDAYEKPHVIIAREFESLFDGVSYATPVVMAEKEEHLGDALLRAKREYQIVIRAQIWGKGHTQKRECESYNVESFREMGLLNDLYNKNLYPIFDRRDLNRESALLATIPTSKPIILVNLVSGQSSPCPACETLMPMIVEEFGDEFDIVDLSKIRAERLYDLIGLMEKSRCLVSIDTSFLHLAGATQIPVVALTNPKPWAGTVVRLNCTSHIPYDVAVVETERVWRAICEAISRPMQQIQNPVITKPIGKIFHCCERHEETDEKTLERKKSAWQSWDTLYQRNEMFPAHLWSFPRTADKVLGDKRPLPFLKDVLENAMRQADDNDVIVWTNDDNWLHPQLAEYLRFHTAVYGVCTSFRSEFAHKLPSADLSPERFDAGASKHMGRDLFAASMDWLTYFFDRIPDFVLGCSDFDLMLACMVRLSLGIKTTNANIFDPIFPAEIPRGYIAHLQHQSHWSRPDYQNSSPAQQHNRRLFAEWGKKNLPDLKFTAQNTL